MRIQKQGEQIREKADGIPPALRKKNSGMNM